MLPNNYQVYVAESDFGKGKVYLIYTFDPYYQEYEGWVRGRGTSWFIYDAFRNIWISSDYPKSVWRRKKVIIAFSIKGDARVTRSTIIELALSMIPKRLNELTQLNNKTLTYTEFAKLVRRGYLVISKAKS